MTNHSTFDLLISNYKSIASLKIGGLLPFTVFVGPNGSGKSNFFDALDFVGKVCRYDVEDALRAHGGADNIRSAKLYKPKSRHFEFTIKLRDANAGKPGDAPSSDYALRIQEFATAPEIGESLSHHGIPWFSRTPGSPVFGHRADRLQNFSYPASMSTLRTFKHLLARLLPNITVYRVDPRSAKEPDPSDADPSKLNARGSNLAAVLGRMESDQEARTLIGQWMEMVVPGVQAITTKRQRLDQSTAILFKEHGTKKQFPAGLMSDGTIYALSLLVAVLDRRRYRRGLTLIEEPERGLHPAAIAEFVDFLRDSAEPENPIWVTTHSESVVRRLQLEELVVVDKKAGRTRMKRADSGNLEQADLDPIGLDMAWLSNLLNGGLPW